MAVVVKVPFYLQKPILVETLSHSCVRETRLYTSNAQVDKVF
jgi:hypothetical protein